MKVPINLNAQVVQLLLVWKKESREKRTHRLGKDCKGDCLCFPFPLAVSSKGAEGLWVWLAFPGSAAQLFLAGFTSLSFNHKGEVTKAKNFVNIFDAAFKCSVLTSHVMEDHEV